MTNILKIYSFIINRKIVTVVYAKRLKEKVLSSVPCFGKQKCTRFDSAITLFSRRYKNTQQSSWIETINVVVDFFTYTFYKTAPSLL